MMNDEDMDIGNHYIAQPLQEIYSKPYQISDYRDYGYHFNNQDYQDIDYHGQGDLNALEASIGDCLKVNASQRFNYTNSYPQQYDQEINFDSFFHRESPISDYSPQ